MNITRDYYKLLDRFYLKYLLQLWFQLKFEIKKLQNELHPNNFSPDSDQKLKQPNATKHSVENMKNSVVSMKNKPK